MTLPWGHVRAYKLAGRGQEPVSPQTTAHSYLTVGDYSPQASEAGTFCLKVSQPRTLFSGTRFGGLLTIQTWSVPGSPQPWRPPSLFAPATLRGLCPLKPWPSHALEGVCPPLAFPTPPPPASKSLFNMPHCPRNTRKRNWGGVGGIRRPKPAIRPVSPPGKDTHVVSPA